MICFHSLQFLSFFLLFRSLKMCSQSFQFSIRRIIISLNYYFEYNESEKEVHIFILLLLCWQQERTHIHFVVDKMSLTVLMFPYKLTQFFSAKFCHYSVGIQMPRENYKMLIRFKKLLLIEMWTRAYVVHFLSISS